MSWAERSKRALATVVVAAAALVGASILLGGDGPSDREWAFLDPQTLADLGLVAHNPSGGEWGLEAHEPATGGRALANHEGEPGATAAVLVATTSRAHDVRASTRCKVASTSSKAEAFDDAPAACGVVMRFVDAQNHWLVRVDAIANMIEVAAIVRGREQVVSRTPTPTPLRIGEWFDLDVEVRGDLVRAQLDGRAAVDTHVVSAPSALGAVGLWVPSGATVYFDRFSIETLSASPRSVELLLLLGRRPG